MEKRELDRVKSLEMLRKLNAKHKSIKNNPELKTIQNALSNLNTNDPKDPALSFAQGESPNQDKKVHKRPEPQSQYRYKRNNLKLQKEKARLENGQNEKEDRGLVLEPLNYKKAHISIPISPWGLSKPGYLKKGSGNYTVLSSQGNINITRALEKKPSAVQYIKSQSSKNGEKHDISYKDNPEPLKYEQDQEHKMFEVQNIKVTHTSNPIAPFFPANRRPSGSVDRKDDSQNPAILIKEEAKEKITEEHSGEEEHDDFKDRQVANNRRYDVVVTEGNKNYDEENKENEIEDIIIGDNEYNKKYKDEKTEDENDFFCFERVNSQITESGALPNRLSSESWKIKDINSFYKEEKPMDFTLNQQSQVKLDKVIEEQSEHKEIVKFDKKETPGNEKKAGSTKGKETKKGEEIDEISKMKEIKNVKKDGEEIKSENKIFKVKEAKNSEEIIDYRNIFKLKEAKNSEEIKDDRNIFKVKDIENAKEKKIERGIQEIKDGKNVEKDIEFVQVYENREKKEVKPTKGPKDTRNPPTTKDKDENQDSNSLKDRELNIEKHEEKEQNSSRELKKKPEYKVQVMASQEIEIKPIHDRVLFHKRKIIKNCSVEPQEPFDIARKLSPKDANLKVEKVGDFFFKAPISKEVQTIARPDTPRFSLEFEPNLHSHIHKPQKSAKIIEFINSFQEEFNQVQETIEERFTTMNNELDKWEERLVWASETMICINSYRQIKQTIRNQKQNKSKKSIASQSEHPKYIKAAENSFGPETQRLSTQQEEDFGDILTTKWAESLDRLEKNDLNGAYDHILSTNDDLYLMRLMFKTSPCLRMLQLSTAKALIGKLACILNSRFVENIGLNWIVDVVSDPENSLDLDFDEYEPLMEALQGICEKGGEEAHEAYKIYEHLVSRLDNN